jgi:imidazolonepropionase-like amidohydrolase
MRGVAVQPPAVQGPVPTPAGPQAAPYRPTRPLALVGGLLIDGTGSLPRHDMTVVTDGERIAQIGPMEDVKIPAGAQVIDASGMTIMPGIMDSNMHVVLNPMYPTPPSVGMSEAAFRERWEGNWARMEREAFTYLMQGITGFRQTPGPADLELALKRKIDSGEVAGPRIHLGGALWMSEVHFQQHLKRHGQSDAKTTEFIRRHFEYNVIKDLKNLDPNGWGVEGPDYNYWKLYFWDDPYDGKNDFTDAEVRYIIERAHQLGKKIDLHAGGDGNPGLRRGLQFDIDTLEHPFERNVIVDEDIIAGYVKKGVIIDTLLQVKIAAPERMADPHRFNESLYIMSMDPREYRLLMGYRDKMLWNQRHPSSRGFATYPPDAGQTAPSYQEQMKIIETAKENMRRFIKAGAKFALGTDTGASMGFRQENPQAREMMHMVEMGMTPMQAIESATRINAEALGMQKDLGTVERGKLADIIVVPGNPLLDIEAAMKRVYVVIKGGVRYK